MSGTLVYMDHQAATPLHADVLAAMTDAAARAWAATTGVHTPARVAAELLEACRADVAALVGAVDPDQVVFTGGTAEARNLAVAGTLAANRHLGAGAVMSAIEHPAVRESAPAARIVAVDAAGLIDPGALASAVQGDTALVSIHLAQHEVGTVQAVERLAAAVREVNTHVRIHVDAVDAVGVLPVGVERLGADLVSFGGPAMGAPAWCGALWMRPGTGLHARIPGGAQELGKRAGAEDLPAIAGMAAAARAARIEGPLRLARRMETARRLAAGVLAVTGVHLNGPPVGDRLPGNLHVRVDGVVGESLALMLGIRGLAVSPGSACEAELGKASPTLMAIGVAEANAHTGVRFSVDHRTTGAEVDEAVHRFAGAVADLRDMSPVGR